MNSQKIYVAVSGLPTKEDRYGIILKDSTEIDSSWFDGERFTEIEHHEVDYWLKETTLDTLLQSQPDRGYLIHKGDEVNSIHAAAMRELNTEQLIALRDKLIRRTPELNGAQVVDEKEIETLQDFEDWYLKAELTDISKMNDFYMSKKRLFEVCKMYADKAANSNRFSENDMKNMADWCRNNCVDSVSVNNYIKSLNK